VLILAKNGFVASAYPHKTVDIFDVSDSINDFSERNRSVFLLDF